MRRRILSLALALGLVSSLIVGAISVSAQPEPPGPPFFDENTILYNAIFFPWVPSGDIIDGTGPWYGSTVIQNLEQEDEDPGKKVKVFFLPSIEYLEEFDPHNPPYNIDLAANGAQIVPIASLLAHPQFDNVHADGSSVVAVAVYLECWNALTLKSNLPGSRGICQSAPLIAGVQKQVAASNFTSGVNTSGNHISVDGYTAIPMTDVAWGPLSDFCFNFRNTDLFALGLRTCDATGLFLSGDADFADFDGHSYLPIVQTNSGWNTVIYVSNTDDSGATTSQVQVTLITTDQQGFGAGFLDKYFFEATLAPGETWKLDVLNEATGPGAGWVGSAWIVSETGMTAIAYRSKGETNMMLVNQAAPSLWATTAELDEWGEIACDHHFADDDDCIMDEPRVMAELIGADRYEQYAPLVFVAYNGWNSGFSLANISEMPNQITLTFYNSAGQIVGGDSRTVSPGGQEFIFVPNYQDLNIGPSFAGSVMFHSNLPFHIAVDQVKYETGEAMSYLATAAGIGNASPNFPGGPHSRYLFMPLVQKGNATTALGDTSGLQLFNAGHEPISVNVNFYLGGGALEAPSKAGPYKITVTPVMNATIYTLAFNEMPTGSRTSAQIFTDGGIGDRYLVGVSNIVNYAVQGDGAVAYNMINAFGQYRFPHPQARYFGPEFFEDICQCELP